MAPPRLERWFCLVSRGIPFPRAFEQLTGETQEAAAARVWRLYRGWTSWIPVVTGTSALWIAILGLAVIAFVVSRGRRRRRRPGLVGQRGDRTAASTSHRHYSTGSEQGEGIDTRGARRG